MIIADVLTSVKPSADKWTEKKLESGKLALRLQSIPGLETRAFRMKDCASKLEYRFCSKCGKYHVAKSYLCRDRLCPTCMWRLSLQRYGEMTKVYSELGTDYNYFLLTLTIKNVPMDELRAAILEMSAAWHDITRKRWGKDNIRGFSRSIEITYNRATHLAHPHIHILLCSSTAFSDADAIRAHVVEEWKHELNLDYQPVIDCREIKPRHTAEIGADEPPITGAVLETFKYTIKSSQLAEMTRSELQEYAAAIRGIRLISYGGCVRQKRLELGYKEPETLTDEMKLDKCPDCGADMAKAVLTWCGISYILTEVEEKPQECRVINC